MILHNQKGASVSWEANGREYRWDPYGACEVPDELVPHLKAQGFPADVAPVPPKEKAERAAASLTDDAKTAEIEKLTKELSTAQALAGEAKRAAEAADLRATAARSEVDGLKDAVRAKDEQLRTAQTDVAEYERMLVETNTKNQDLADQLRLAEAAKHPAASKSSKQTG